MDYKKMYKEALARAKKLKETFDSTGIAGWSEYIFPELMLQEEDERIRETLIKFHKSTIDIDGIKGVDIISWLEKQGEQKVWENVEPVTEDDKLHLIMNEQNPAWSEEDECHFNDVLWCCKQAAKTAKDENDMGTIWYAEKWLKSLKERMKGE